MSKLYLTDRLVRGLETTVGRAEAWDTVVSGLGLRYSGRKKSWFFVFHSPELHDGRGHRRRRRMTLGEFPKVSLAAARARGAEIRAQLAQGIDPALGRVRSSPRQGLRFRELGEEYLEGESKPKKVRWTQDSSALRSLLPAFGDRLVSEITRAEIEAYLEAIRTERGRWAADDHHKVLARLLEWGVSRRGLPHNPARGIARQPLPPRERVLSAQEVGRLWRACEADGSSSGSVILRLRLATGQRGTQLQQLNVAQLEREAGGLWWNVPSQITKTRRPNRLYLGALAESVLGELMPDEKGRYFGCHSNPRPGSRAGDKSQRRIRRGVGLAPWKGMDLRRTAATWMAQRGVPRFILKRVLGHADRDITAVYDLYSYDREVKAAVLILEQAIREAIGEVPPAKPVPVEPVGFEIPGGSPFFPQFPGLPR